MKSLKERSHSARRGQDLFSTNAPVVSKEWCRRTIDFYAIKIELGNHPRTFLLCVDQMVVKLEKVERPIDSKDIDIMILSSFPPQYDAKVGILKSS